MYKQHMIGKTELYHSDLSDLEEFLLAHSFSKQAFINLSRVKEFIDKEELLEEIKRLIKEQIIHQIKTSQGFH